MVSFLSELSYPLSKDCSLFPLLVPLPCCSWLFTLSLSIDVLGNIMKNITAKRSRARIVDKLLALGLVAERRELYKKRRKKLAPSSLVTVLPWLCQLGMPPSHPSPPAVLLRSSPPRFFLPQALLTRSPPVGESGTRGRHTVPYLVSFGPFLTPMNCSLMKRNPCTIFARKI